MTVDEIFRDLAKHSLDGVMVHEEMSTYYRFLNFKGYSRMHEYHMAKEYCGYKKLCRYYMSRYHRIIPKHVPEQQNVIPDTWYNYKQIDVDANTKRKAVKSGLEKWVLWEQETKDFYQKMHHELCEIGETAAAMFLADYIREVDHELSKAESYHITKNTNDYSLAMIEEEQKKKHHDYKEKISCVGKMLC